MQNDADVFRSLEADNDDDDMANDVIRELGFENGTTNSAFRNSLTQHGDEEEKKEGAGDDDVVVASSDSD